MYTLGPAPERELLWMGSPLHSSTCCYPGKHLHILNNVYYSEIKNYKFCIRGYHMLNLFPLRWRPSSRRPGQ